ncbi:MAG: ABC transporter permease [Spirochaetaceae bacterium]|jgi:simple sugar transport system permease protein|nr:ABC transporter permease [Spirochaetaceae bacterium]
MNDIIMSVLSKVSSVLMMWAPLFIASTGGMICERSGVTNIALEGLMAIGAMSAATTHALLEAALVEGGWTEVQAGLVSIPGALILAAFFGCLFSLIHAFASITLRADQVVSGTGINLLSTGLTVFFCQVIFHQDRSGTFKRAMPNFMGFYPTVLIGLVILVVSWYMLYKRPWGLRLRACGEHPQAVASAGVDVVKIRYIAVLVSGVLAGLAGGCLVLTQTQYTIYTVNGHGFIALAAVSFGRWLPIGILGSSLLFAVSSVLSVISGGMRTLREILPSDFFALLPYLITLLTLIIFSGKDYAPRAVGQPYDKGKR